MGFPTRSDTYRAVQPQKKARSLALGSRGIAHNDYLCSLNKGTDQLCSYSELLCS